MPRMQAYLPTIVAHSARIEFMYFEPWQSGYFDILNRGFPRPEDPRSPLVQLRSPSVPDVLVGNTGSVPMLLNERASAVLTQASLSGFEVIPAVVAKVASLGVRKRNALHGEPEDAILKSRGVSLDLAPQLFALWVNALVEVVPEDPSGRTDSGVLSPFACPREAAGLDTWRPSLHGKPHTGWAFCSERFRTSCVSNGLTGIGFEPLEDVMERLRTA